MLSLFVGLNLTELVIFSNSLILLMILLFQYFLLVIGVLSVVAFVGNLIPNLLLTWLLCKYFTNIMVTPPFDNANYGINTQLYYDVCFVPYCSSLSVEGVVKGGATMILPVFF